MSYALPFYALLPVNVVKQPLPGNSFQNTAQARVNAFACNPEGMWDLEKLVKTLSLDALHIYVRNWLNLSHLSFFTVFHKMRLGVISYWG